MTETDRRSIIAALAGGIAGMTATRTAAREIVLPFANGVRPLVAYPQKRPLIQLTQRPPQLETPLSVFAEGPITPNDAFFVRYHLSDLPLQIDPMTFRLTVNGHVERPLSLSLTELKRDFPVQEIVAVNQCSGNSRGFSDPRVGGGQLGHGAMGNSRWTGVPLRALLDRAGVTAEARQVTFNGLDNPPVDGVPDFVKALDIDHARDGEVMLAWGMAGADLPFLNGYPLRLVVPGHYGTYWIKHLNEINVVDAAYDGYWMKTAYRIPDNDCACVPPGTKPEKTRPIGRLNVRSLLTSHAQNARVKAGQREQLSGIAFDGGSGIAQVEISTDGGVRWRPASLGQDLGRYSFRQWSLPVTLDRGAYRILVRATSRSGEIQPMEQRWQPAGYMRNRIEAVEVIAL